MEIMLVYQCGLANVFDGNFKRLMQHAYGPCEWFCKGAVAMGATVRVFHCDTTGDISATRLGYWRSGPGEMSADAKRPPIAA